jgi:hypothetical protein
LVSQAKILRTYVITFCSQANVITFPYKRDPSSISAGMDYAAPTRVTLEAGSELPHQRRRPPLHRRIAGDSDHLCISSNNDLRSGWYASSSDHLRVSAAVKGPRPHPPTGGDNEAIKAKESGTQRQVALMVPAAEATTSARAASPAAATTSAPTTMATSAQEVLAPVLPRSEDKTIQERRRHSRSVRCLGRSPRTAGGAGKAVGLADPRTARPSLVWWTDSHVPTKRQEAASEAATGPPRPRARHETAVSQSSPPSRGW